VQLSYFLASSLIGKYSLSYFLIAAAIYVALTLQYLVSNRDAAARIIERQGSGRKIAFVAVVIWIIGVTYTILVVQWSLKAGRLAMDSIADDVGYLSDGLGRLNILHQGGFWALLRSFWSSPPHSPWATVSALLGFAIFGVHDWSPYLIYGSLVLVTLFAANELLVPSNSANRVLILISILLTPLMLRAVHEFRPDFAVALFSDLFALAVLRLACMQRANRHEARTHFFVGLLGGLAYLAKPAFFAYITVICIASVALAEICHRIFSSDRLQLRETMQRLGGTVLGILILALPYYSVAWKDVLDYFFQQGLSGAEADIWKVPGGVSESFKLFILGPYMVQNLGFFGPLLLLWIILGFVASIIRKAAPALAFTICGVILAILSASIIVLGRMNNIYFGQTWQLMLLFVAVFAIGEVSRSDRLMLPAVGACALSIALCLAYPPTKNIWVVCPDCRGETSVNYRVLNAIVEKSKLGPPLRENPSVFVTFAGNVSAYTQSWLATKNHITVTLSDLHRSGCVEAQLARAQTANFVEVADPKSQWLYHWLPTGPIQAQILSDIRANASFEELNPVVGSEGVLYLFQKKGS
jgi:hypothetical protein